MKFWVGRWDHQKWMWTEKRSSKTEPWDTLMLRDQVSGGGNSTENRWATSEVGGKTAKCGRSQVERLFWGGGSDKLSKAADSSRKTRITNWILGLAIWKSLLTLMNSFAGVMERECLIEVGSRENWRRGVGIVRTGNSQVVLQQRGAKKQCSSWKGKSRFCKDRRNYKMVVWERCSRQKDGCYRRGICWWVVPE